MDRKLMEIENEKKNQNDNEIIDVDKIDEPIQ